MGVITALAGINLLDTATHTWDLATATGQPPELPEPVAVGALEASRSIVSPEIRAGRFGPEQPTPDGASATVRLAPSSGARRDHAPRRHPRGVDPRRDVPCSRRRRTSIADATSSPSSAAPSPAPVGGWRGGHCDGRRRDLRNVTAPHQTHVVRERELRVVRDEALHELGGVLGCDRVGVAVDDLPLAVFAAKHGGGSERVGQRW